MRTVNFINHTFVFIAMLAICLNGLSVKAQNTASISQGKKLKVMVTGHRGYIGSRFVEAVKQKYDIVGYDIVEGDDILDYNNLKKKMEGVDIVVHEAAIPKPTPGKSFEDYRYRRIERTPKTPYLRRFG